MIRVGNVIYGGERFTENGESLIDLGDHLMGFSLDKTGRLRASNANLSGVIDAASGHFKDCFAHDLTITGGSITIGPLHVSDKETDPSKDVTYASSYDARNFINLYLPESITNGQSPIIKTVPLYYGGECNTWDLYSMEFEKRWFTAPNHGGTYYYHIIRFNTSGGQKTTSFDLNNGVGTPRLGYTVVIYGGGAGKTFKLSDVPDADPHEVGKLYKNAAGQLFISNG